VRSIRFCGSDYETLLKLLSELPPTQGGKKLFTFYESRLTLINPIERKPALLKGRKNYIPPYPLKINRPEVGHKIDKTMLNYRCEFDSPRNWENEAPVSKSDFWNYSEISCTSTEPTSTIALISNPDTGAQFYLDKTLNYGEVLILVFLLLFAIFGIVKIIADFFIPRRVSKF